MKTILLLLLLPLSLFAQLCGKVVGISDGDTFTMLLKNNTTIKVRLHGIDCPEKNQDFGQVAKQFASDEIYGKEVCIEDKGTDKYGRTLGIVHYNNKVLNQELIKAGLAWHYLKYDQTAALTEMEDKARENKIGLWSMPNAIAPWEFRHK